MFAGEILCLGKSLDFRTEMQSYQSNFRTDTDAGREDCFAQTRVHMELLTIGMIQPAVLREHVSARAPSEERELHCMSVSGKCQRIVLPENFRLPMKRVMGKQDAEHSVGAVRCFCKVPARREVSRR